MRRWLRAALCALLIVGAIAAGLYVAGNQVDPAAGTAPFIAGAPPSAAVVARGAYLTAAADCIACHTVPGTGRPFAGGVAFRLPFGTIYSSNITADRERGIGAWSDEQFVRAVRDGVRSDGKHLYPAFPYTAYTLLSRADVLAIKAYLFSLPAVDKSNRRNDLLFPFNQRWVMGFWNALFFKDRRFVADPSRSARINSGAYLATALAHCGECHTPRNLGFGLEHGQELAGAELQGWRAYNITADPTHGIGAWSDADLIAYVSTGHASLRGSAAGPMGEAVTDSLQFLNDDDVGSLVTFLRTVPARSGTQPIDVSSAPLVDADGVHANGRELFEGACASCHVSDGTGRQSPYAALTGNRGVNDCGGVNVVQVILQGVDWHIAGNHVYMPGFAGAYTDTEVAALANYVIAQFGGKAGTVTPSGVAARRTL